MPLPLRCFLFGALATAAVASEPDANRVLADYFAREVTAIEAQPLPLPTTREKWKTQRAGMRRQLAGMLGLEPIPPHTPLEAAATGETTISDIVIEKLHYQSMPGL